MKRKTWALLCLLGIVGAYTLISAVVIAIDPFQVYRLAARYMPPIDNLTQVYANAGIVRNYDYDSAIAMLESGKIKTRTPAWCKGTAAKLRAQICVNENAEAAARQQARLLRQSGVSEAVTQRAAKDILDRAGVRVPKEEKKDVTVTFVHGAPLLGMPARYEEDE